MRVLILEPHPDVRDLIERVVRRSGHDPIIGTPDTELEVDAAVIEPGAELGLATARRLKEQGTRIIFVSIFSAEEGALQLAPTAYLVKPFSLRALEAALTEV